MSCLERTKQCFHLSCVRLVVFRKTDSSGLIEVVTYYVIKAILKPRLQPGHVLDSAFLSEFFDKFVEADLMLKQLGSVVLTSERKS